jgi:sulfatase maturation enzyme AslB (radical SAM superfamily)
MYCPRLEHFVRFNPNGTVSRCGHMVNPPQFSSLVNMNASSWLANTRELMHLDQWPTECVRCRETEQETGTSIRLHAIQVDSATQQRNYLQVGGVLDNLCNAACLMCDQQLSTRIGSLHGRIFPIVDNSKSFWSLPQDRIVHLDINGGEPSYSKNYKRILANLPPNLKTLRLNTNCSTVLTELTEVADRGIEVTVTVSCDGIGAVHESVRWPLTWTDFYKNLMAYKNMPVRLNLWTTVSVLNVDDLPNIQAFAQAHGIDHEYAYLQDPEPLAVNNRGSDSSIAYIRMQKNLRGLP